jgi:hypothetical protein
MATIFCIRVFFLDRVATGNGVEILCTLGKLPALILRANPLLNVRERTRAQAALIDVSPSYLCARKFLVTATW